MAYSYQQIAEATPEALKADAGLLKTVKTLYGTPDLEDSVFLERYNQPAGQFATGKEYVLNQQLSLTPGNELNRNFDRYINWNNPANPADQAAANIEREKGLAALAEYTNRYKALGIDPSTVPFIQQMTQGFGATAGGGQTSAQTADQINKEKAAPVQTPADQWKPADNKPVAGQTPATPAPANVSPAALAKPGIADLIASGREFNDLDAKNFAFANGDDNWQQYVGGVGGQPNANYIGATNWANLQKTYTPYQLQQATTRTANGIYWNPNVNIGSIPRVDPATQINKDTKAIANIVSDANKTADKLTKGSGKTDDKAKDEENQDPNAIEASVKKMLNDKYGGTAEAIYNELFNTPEMKAAKNDVSKYKTQLDEYDQQLEELKGDIRKEVEGEASESYITALATIRGEKILKQKRATQRDYDTALAQYNGLKDNATNLLEVRTKDADTRYNRLFSMLQLQIQQEGTAFNQDIAIAQVAMQIPEGRTMTIGGQTVKGLKENDNINVVQFTDAGGKNYVIGIDKKTGKETYKTYIGTSRIPGTGTAETPVTFDEAMYWLSLAKDKDGNPDLSKIPEKYRSGVVKTLTENKDKMPKKEEKSWWEKLGDSVNIFDGK